MKLKQMTYLDAYDDFRKWLPQQDRWQNMVKREKQYIAKADEARRKGTLGIERVKALLEKYAPERYTITVLVSV
jgi:hypothetical protein